MLQTWIISAYFQLYRTTTTRNETVGSVSKTVHCSWDFGCQLNQKAIMHWYLCQMVAACWNMI